MLLGISVSVSLIPMALFVSFNIVKDLSNRVKNLTSVMAKVHHENDLTVHSVVVS